MKLIPVLTLNSLKKLKADTGKEQNAWVWLFLQAILGNGLSTLLRQEIGPFHIVIGTADDWNTRQFQNIIIISIARCAGYSSLQISWFLLSTVPQPPMLQCHTAEEGGKMLERDVTKR